MERLARRGMEVAGKVVSLFGAFATILLRDQSPGASGDSGNHPYRPVPATHSMLTSNPLIPAFLVLTIILLALSSAPIQKWFAEGGSLPTLTQILAPFQHKKGPPRLTAASEVLGVWAIKQFGFYYCQGGALFGTGPGELMTQDDALMSGYRPAGGQYCRAGNSREASAGSVPFRVRQWLRSTANRLPSTDDLFARFLKKQPSLPKASEDVTVWTIRSFGYYYCQNEVLFGKKPGEPMKQVVALVSGYRPASHQYCVNTKPNEASAARLTLPTSPVR